MLIPFYNHLRKYNSLKEQTDAIIAKVYEAEIWSVCPMARHLEGRYAKHMGMRYGITVDSATDALVLALRALKVGAGDEVITTYNPFSTTVEAILFADAIPVLVDIDADTFTIDPRFIEDKITSRTKAIVAVHTYGHPADISAITKIANKHNLLVLEDCVHASGSCGNTFRTGELSDAICASSGGTTNIGPSGDAGVVMTNHEEIVQPIRDMRIPGSAKYNQESRDRLEQALSMIVRARLKYTYEWNELRTERANEYHEQLKCTGLKLPKAMPGYRHGYGLYVIETQGRDDLKRFLRDSGIAALSSFPLDIFTEQRFPNIRSCADHLPVTKCHTMQCLALPMYPELTSEEVNFIADSIKKWRRTQHK